MIFNKQTKLKAELYDIDEKIETKSAELKSLKETLNNLNYSFQIEINIESLIEYHKNNIKNKKKPKSSFRIRSEDEGPDFKPGLEAIRRGQELITGIKDIIG